MRGVVLLLTAVLLFLLLFLRPFSVGRAVGVPLSPPVSPDGVVDLDRDGDPALFYGGSDCDDLNPDLNGLDLDRDGLSSCDGDFDEIQTFKS